jgi:hypothetical protein
METLKTIRLQLSAVEDAYRERRLREVIDTLVTIHDLIDVLASAFLSEQMRNARTQLDRLADVGLVVSDLEDKLDLAQNEPSPSMAAELIDEVWTSIREMLDPTGKLLVRTNIFPRGKKTFMPYAAGDTLKAIGEALKKRYAVRIAEHLRARGAAVVVPEAVDIVFYGARVWEDPDEAVLSEHARVADLAKIENEGILWFPVMPGDSPVLFDNEEEEEEGFMNLLENFTIEADVSQLEAEMHRLASGMNRSDAHAPAAGWRSKAYLVRGEGTDREERIPIVGERISLGRGRENDIQILNDIKVSRFHCRILRESDAYYIEDNSSSNGTVVDGEIISRRQLVGGEMLGIGNTAFRFLKD